MLLNECLEKCADDAEIEIVTDDVSGGMPDILFTGTIAAYKTDTEMRRYDGVRVFGSKTDSDAVLSKVWVDPWDCERAND